MLNLEHRSHRLEELRKALAIITYPLQYLSDLPGNVGRAMADSFAERNALSSENESLRQQNLKLLARQQKFDALEVENMRLRSLLESSFKVGDHILVTELMQMDLDPYRHQVVINRGSRAGVYIGQPALDANAVMGQVIHVTPWNATVLLISDSTHTLPVQVNRSGLRTIAVGTGELNSLKLPFLPNNADIKEGDLLVTSGLDGRYPSGYPVAEVNSIRRAPDASFAEATATPKAHLDRAHEVLLVWTLAPKHENEPPSQESGETAPEGPAAPSTQESIQ